jgi:hypothetical protein
MHLEKEKVRIMSREIGGSNATSALSFRGGLENSLGSLENSSFSRRSPGASRTGLSGPDEETFLEESGSDEEVPATHQEDSQSLETS